MIRIRTIALLALLLTASAKPINGTWIEPELSASPPARYGHSMVMVYGSDGGHAYVLGGRSDIPSSSHSSSSTLGNIFRDMWKFQHDDDLWEELENENPELARYVMQTSCINGDIYVLCGKDSLGDYLFDVWKYDFGELEWVKWEAAVPMAARAYHKAAAMKGKIWISGGENDEGDIDEMWSYNPGLHSWEQKADMPYALSGHTMVSNNDELYVYGVVTKTLRYDYDDDLWYMQIPVNDPPPNRIYHTTVPNWENNSMIVFGGQTLEGEELSDIWEYFYDTNKWSYRGEMPISLTQSAGVMIHSSTRQSGTFLGSIDRVVLFGGISGGVPTNRTFVNYPNLVNIFLPLVLRS